MQVMAFFLRLFLFSFLLILHSQNSKAENDEKSGDSIKEEEKVLKYTRPYVGDLAHFAEPFHSQEEFDASWILSQAKKDGVEAAIAKYDGKWSIQEPKDNPIVGDHGLVLTSEAKHAAVASLLKEPFKFEDRPLIVQYEVRFQKKQECGGAYVKLLADSPTLDLNEFGDKVEYTIMFGPDKCGTDGKIHFIFQHESPITHKMEEKHAKKVNGDFSKIFDDNKTHLLTLIIRPDNSYEILVDKVQVSEGSLLKDMTPPVNPPKEIEDPEDVKPEDWDEREKIPDATATKPDDWDEDAPKTIVDANAKKPDGWLDDAQDLIPDPAAVKPEDWDDAEDGEWEAPQINNPQCKAVGCGTWTPPTIKNPNYKGVWSAPMIANPSYKGIWKARIISNPDFFEDNNPFAMKSIVAVGYELWSMQSDILFDNILIADDLSTVLQWTAQTWDLKHSKEVASEPSAVGSMWKSLKDATDEKPWLWAVVVGAILLPIVLIYIFCFPAKEDKTAAIHKKTDDVVPDDDKSENSDVSAETVVEKSTEVTKEKQKETKEELPSEDPKSEEEPEINQQKAADAEDIEGTKDEKNEETQEVKDLNSDENEDKQEDEKENIEDSEEVPQSSPKTRSSRRKTRKDT